MEPEWRFRRPVAVNVDAKNRIVVLGVGPPPPTGLQQAQGLRRAFPKPLGLINLQVGGRLKALFPKRLGWSFLGSMAA